jgi:hypothetical protein
LLVIAGFTTKHAKQWARLWRLARSMAALAPAGAKSAIL